MRSELCGLQCICPTEERGHFVGSCFEETCSVGCAACAVTAPGLQMLRQQVAAATGLQDVKALKSLACLACRASGGGRDAAGEAVAQGTRLHKGRRRHPAHLSSRHRAFIEVPLPPPPPLLCAAGSSAQLCCPTCKHGKTGTFRSKYRMHKQLAADDQHLKLHHSHRCRWMTSGRRPARTPRAASGSRPARYV